MVCRARDLLAAYGRMRCRFVDAERERLNRSQNAGETAVLKVVCSVD